MRGLPRRGTLARAPVGRRPLFYRGDSRRKRRGARRRRQRARAVGYMGYMGHVGEGGVGTKLSIKLYIAEVVATEVGWCCFGSNGPAVGIVIGGS